MLTHTELKKGVKIILDKEPYEILESSPMKKAQRRVVIQARIKNIITGSVVYRNFHQSETVQEAELSRIEVKFLYTHREQYFFSEKENPSKRFSLNPEQIGSQAQFLKSNQIVEAVIFEDKVINISLPIKIQLKVTDSPPGTKGDRAQGGNKTATLETGAKISVPLFIENDDIVEINTETGEYVKRIQ